MLGKKTLLTEWQVGDGREARAGEYVLNTGQRGDVDDVVRAIGDFA
jgi:hypothetical protein